MNVNPTLISKLLSSVNNDSHATVVKFMETNFLIVLYQTFIKYKSILRLKEATWLDNFLNSTLTALIFILSMVPLSYFISAWMCFSMITTLL